MNNNHIWVAIIAGGQGTRLFPISHPDRPKQFCQLDKQSTFIQAVIHNFASLGIDPSHFVIVTSNETQTELAKKQTLSRGIFSQNIIQLDSDWGYVGAMYKATEFIAKLDPGAVIINTPSDQYLRADDDDFEYTIKTAVAEAENDHAVLVGVKVNDLDIAIGCGHAIYEDDDRGCYTVQKFVEKPDYDLADKIMRQGNSACNTGITVWRPRTLLSRFAHDYEARGIGTDQLMFKFEKLKIAVGSFEWYDCGTLKSLYEVSDKTPHHKNASLGDGSFERVRCRHCLLYAGKGMELSVSDAEGVAVVFNMVDDRPVIGVFKLEGGSQDVKEFAEEYSKHRKFLKRDFSFDARNNLVLGSNVSKETIFVFAGVSNYAVLVRKRSDDTLEAIVSKQFTVNDDEE